MPTPEEMVADGERVGRFLQDPAVLGAFDKVRAQAVADMLAATTNEQRVAGQALHKAVGHLVARLNAIYSNGKVEAKNIESKKRKPVPGF